MDQKLKDAALRKVIEATPVDTGAMKYLALTGSIVSAVWHAQNKTPISEFFTWSRHKDEAKS